jgi:hypothetical protein
VAAYTVVNGDNQDYSNINAGGVDVGAMSYRDAVTLTNTELATLLDGTSFPNAAVFPDQAAITPVAAATQRKRTCAIAALYPNPLA